VRKGTEQLGNHEPITHEVVNAVVAEYLGALSARSLVVIDGYPKYIEQIPPFVENVQLAGATILSIMHVVVPDEVAINRIVSRGVRAGETGLDLEFAQRRLSEHQTGARVATEALAATYPIDVIDGTQPMNSVIWTMRQILESS
jgi:adenylate kinase family enzyme